MRRPELLIPAGSLENLKIAVKYGADAVYIGGEVFSLRAKAKNFSMEQMKEGIEFAHKHGVKVYVTANIIPHNSDIEIARNYFKEIKDLYADAIIIADPGVLMLAKEYLPEVEIHLSTQANNTNYASMNFWHSIGVKRIVAAREMSFEEIKQCNQMTDDDLDIEAFVHGAMCISYSGRCLLSNYMTNKDANKGACTHACRWKYNLVEETRPNEYMPVFENERGTFIYNSKDLGMISHIDKLLDAGVYSFKIEGRMKTALYVATITKIWREAIDDYLDDEDKYFSKLDYYEKEVRKCTYRQFTTGFYYDKPKETEQIYDKNSYVKEYKFVGRGIYYDNENGLAVIEQRNKFVLGDTLEVITEKGENEKIKVEKMFNEDGESIESAPHPKQIIKIKTSVKVADNDIIRKKVD